MNSSSKAILFFISMIIIPFRIFIISSLDGYFENSYYVVIFLIPLLLLLLFIVFSIIIGIRENNYKDILSIDKNFSINNFTFFLFLARRTRKNINYEKLFLNSMYIVILIRISQIMTKQLYYEKTIFTLKHISIILLVSLIFSVAMILLFRLLSIFFEYLEIKKINIGEKIYIKGINDAHIYKEILSSNIKDIEKEKRCIRIKGENKRQIIVPKTDNIEEKLKKEIVLSDIAKD